MKPQMPTGNQDSAPQTSMNGHQHPLTQEDAPADSSLSVRELAGIPATEVISNTIILLMSAAAEKLGLADADPSVSESLDLDEARKLITALAGLVQAATPDLGLHSKPIRDGVKSLQAAFREASAFPDLPGQGPGEKLV